MSTQTKTSEINWEERYPQLHTHARRLVNQMKIMHWQGQEEDMAWDIVQESMRKILEYTRKAEQGEEKPVKELAGLLHMTARNCILDVRRREKRLCREITALPTGFIDNRANFSEVAIENAYNEGLFRLLARKIAQFPPKQRQALLADLAHRMSFGEKPTTLQAAFQAEGIRLEEYRHLQPANERERTRNAALLYQAYQRLKNLDDVQEYLA